MGGDDDGDVPVDAEAGVSLENLKEEVPWLNHSIFKLSPLIFGAGIMTAGFRYGYSGQMDKYMQDCASGARVLIPVDGGNIYGGGLHSLG